MVVVGSSSGYSSSGSSSSSIRTLEFVNKLFDYLNSRPVLDLVAAEISGQVRKVTVYIKVVRANNMRTL